MDAEMVKILLGQQSDYFIREFEKINTKQKSFYWPAFVIGPIAALYRKNTPYFIRFSLPLFIAPIVFALAMKISLIFGMILSAVGSIIVYVILPIFGAFQFNRYYHEHLATLIQKYNLTPDTANQPEQMQIIRKYIKPSIGRSILINIALLILCSFISQLLMTDTNENTDMTWDEAYVDELPPTEEDISVVEEMQKGAPESLVEIYQSLIEVRIEQFSMPEKSAAFIQNNASFFPVSSRGAFYEARSMADLSLDYRKLIKNPVAFSDSFVFVEGTILQIFENDLDGEGSFLSEMLISDFNGNNYWVEYLASVDLYEGDSVSCIGLPVSSYYFDNVGGTTTTSILLIGSYVGDGEYPDSAETDSALPLSPETKTLSEYDATKNWNLFLSNYTMYLEEDFAAYDANDSLEKRNDMYLKIISKQDILTSLYLWNDSMETTDEWSYAISKSSLEDFVYQLFGVSYTIPPDFNNYRDDVALGYEDGYMYCTYVDSIYYSWPQVSKVEEGKNGIITLHGYLTYNGNLKRAFEAEATPSNKSVYGYNLTKFQTLEASPKNIKSATSSSELNSTSNHSYGPENIIDGRMSTVWSEGVSGNGIGEWVNLELDEKTEISALFIYPGHYGSEELFYNNNSVYEIELLFSDGETETHYASEGYYDQGTLIVLNKPHLSSSVKITIVSVNEGLQYNDTCISDVLVY